MNSDDIFEKAYEKVILWENQCLESYELEQPIKELIEIGNNGHIKALMVLANLSKFDLEELEGTSASDWYCKAADFGSLYAKYKYIESQLGKIDFVEVEKELVSLGKKGYIPAYSKLGVCYARGIGVTKDREVAAPYLKIAADGGSYEAGLQYVELLQYGEGVEKNIEEAVYYFKKCVEIARKGEEDAEFNSYTSSSSEETEYIDTYEDAKEMFHQFLEDNKLEVSRLE